jgi:hypothetical protein
MKKGILAILSTLFVVASFTAPALASFNFQGSPSFTNLAGDGYDVNLHAEATGLGNTDMVGSIVFSGTVQYTCQNNGGNTAPGQPLQITTQPVTKSVGEPKNGNAVLDLTASFVPPATVPGKDIGCPSGKWTGINPVVIGPVSATGTITWGGETKFGPTTITVTNP